MLEESLQELHVDPAIRLGGKMHRLFVLRNNKSGSFGAHALINLWALLFCFGIGALAQSTAPPLNANAPFNIRATHVLGLPNTKSNCKGTLSTHDNVLRFQQSGKPIAQINIASVRVIFLGEESMQVGGVPMEIGKAAAPYGGGRVVSLFAHKKYDMLTLEYVDSNGGVHGAIFQVTKGQGELVKNELVVRGVSSSSCKDQLTKKSTSEVAHEDK
jgi:hypothetical protein